jgi:hypothetical protein
VLRATWSNPTFLSTVSEKAIAKIELNTTGIHHRGLLEMW